MRRWRRIRGQWRRRRQIRGQWTDDELHEAYQAFLDALPDGRVGFACLRPKDERRLNQLAARDGYRIECVGYSGVLDYQLWPRDWPVHRRPPGA